MLNITDVRVRPVRNHGIVRAYASITIDGCFVVHDIRLLENDRGEFIAMPSRAIRGQQEGQSRRFIDTSHPLNRETREQILNAISAAYHEMAVEDEPVEDGEVLSD